MRASSSDRSIACPASLVLPTVVRIRPEKTERAAAFGTLAHWWKETGESDPDWADPRDVKCLERKLFLSGIKREEWWSGGEHEVTFALDLATLELHEYGEGKGEQFLTRDKWKEQWSGMPGWLTGTIDYLWPDGSINDLKTGAWPVDPWTSKQLRSYALHPWVKAGRPPRWNVLLGIDWWQKYPQNGLPIRTEALTSGFELHDHLEDLRWASEHPEEVNPGDEQCRWCESKPLCPAHVDGDWEVGNGTAH